MQAPLRDDGEEDDAGGRRGGMTPALENACLARVLRQANMDQALCVFCWLDARLAAQRRGDAAGVAEKRGGSDRRVSCR